MRKSDSFAPKPGRPQGIAPTYTRASWADSYILGAIPCGRPGAKSNTIIAEERETMTQQGSTPVEGASDFTIAEVRFEHHSHPLGIGEARPRLSWVVDTETAGWRQAAYEIEAYGSEGQLSDRTGRVESDQSVLVPWPFAPLSSRDRLAVRVRVWGINGHLSAW